MKKRFHINKHGIPVVCRFPKGRCFYGDESVHFESYEQAKQHIDNINKAIRGKVILPIEHSAQKIRSYYSSREAINEFQVNKKIADLPDFDLIIISWLAIEKVKEGMKENRIGNVKFTYGDIVRIVEEELKLRPEYKNGLKLEEKYYNPIPFDLWEDHMKKQRRKYRDSTDKLTKALAFESMSIISVPMSARKRLAQDGYLTNPENINEVIYKVSPKVSQFGDIIVYNHNTNETSKEFDVYEIAGAIEGKTLHDLCYEENVESKFNKIWESAEFTSNINVDYEVALERYKKEQFFKGLEGTSIPRAFVRMSPIAAKEIANFVFTHRRIMRAIGEIMNDDDFKDMFPSVFDKDSDDDDGWTIE